MTSEKSAADRAEELFRQGYNCSQAVAAVFAEKTGTDVDTVLKVSCPFGGGFARKRYICGAVSGMGIVLSLINADTSPDAKKTVYPAVRELCDDFEDHFGTIICSELLNNSASHDDPPSPEERSDKYYKKRCCIDCIRYAAELLESKLDNAGAL